MRKIVGFINDFIKCFIIGTLITFSIAFFVGIFSLIISKFNFEQAIQNIKSILLIVGSLGMILGGLLIINIKNRKELVFIDQWKEKYKILSYKTVLIVVSCVIVLYGGIIDWINYKF
ncbi:MAG: hypothetical protein KHZ99_08435 [Clostridium sp.]|uniref:hypothetical protein n=1 Tax=Clostridium sp. TaxID=1506 RepID=UPI0025C0ED02|nr:hypothetical protein [Clostridium sp.]MBS4957064.1 hypothetical protein [Clostridium sp.]